MKILFYLTTFTTHITSHYLFFKAAHHIILLYVIWGVFWAFFFFFINNIIRFVFLCFASINENAIRVEKNSRSIFFFLSSTAVERPKESRDCWYICSGKDKGDQSEHLRSLLIYLQIAFLFPPSNGIISHHHHHL